jgi:predicted ArsR family transcriptional regulator
MLEAGVVVRVRSPQPRGRPRHEWSLSPDAAPRGRARAYGDLSRWLSRAIPARPSRLREVERAGREIGREVAPAAGEPVDVALRDALTALGFQPVVERDGAGGISCRLRNCPYSDSVRENQEVVCTLHRGITQGMLDVLEPRARLSAFVPHDPDTAGCEIEVQGAPPGR